MKLIFVLLIFFNSNKDDDVDGSPKNHHLLKPHIMPRSFLSPL